MEKLDDLLNSSERALASLVKLVGIENADDVVQDAAIQRFEYTLEAVWKACQRHLLDEGYPVASPKATIRQGRDSGLLSDEDAELALEMVRVRNLTTHTYNEELARGAYPRLPEFSALLQRRLAAIRTHRSP